jgi:hypothetical protein
LAGPWPAIPPPRPGRARQTTLRTWRREGADSDRAGVGVGMHKISGNGATCGGRLFSPARQPRPQLASLLPCALARRLPMPQHCSDDGASLAAPSRAGASLRVLHSAKARHPRSTALALQGVGFGFSAREALKRTPPSWPRLHTPTEKRGSGVASKRTALASQPPLRRRAAACARHSPCWKPFLKRRCTSFRCCMRPVPVVFLPLAFTLQLSAHRTRGGRRSARGPRTPSAYYLALRSARPPPSGIAAQRWSSIQSPGAVMAAQPARRPAPPGTAPVRRCPPAAAIIVSALTAPNLGSRVAARTAGALLAMERAAPAPAAQGVRLGVPQTCNGEGVQGGPREPAAPAGQRWQAGVMAGGETHQRIPFPCPSFPWLLMCGADI